jgi:hypothetical protein
MAKKLDVITLVRELDKLGLRLSAIRHLDGNVRLYRWRQMNYWQNETTIKRLWDENVGSDEKSIADLAESIAKLNIGVSDAPLRASTAA